MGAAEAAPGITSVSILDTEPPLFFVNLSSGGTVECSSEDLLSSRSFQVLALQQCKMVLPLYKHDIWLAHITQCIENATIIEAPQEVGVSGQFFELLERFCTDKHRAREKDELLLGKPWYDDERERYVFRLRDLQDFLDRLKFRDFTRSMITTRLRERGGGSDFFNLKGRGVNVWWMPAVFEVQQEPHATPQMEESPI